MIIRKETVRTVIALANAAGGGHISTHDRHLLETARKAIGGELNWGEVYDRFLRRLSQMEVAELLVLRLLGKDQGQSPERWDVLVKRASKLSLIKLYDLPISRLPQYLRLGMERLARFRFKRAKDDPHLEERRRELVGLCFLKTYRDKYGGEAGLKMLADFMDARGMLETTADRLLFGLPPKEDDLDDTNEINLDQTIG